MAENKVASASGDVRDTKQRIIEAAEDLFSQYGFGGTSIRDIAKRSEVNVAAINYHFKSKESLYWDICFAARQEMEARIAGIASKVDSTEELAVQAFDAHARNERQASQYL